MHSLSSPSNHSHLSQAQASNDVQRANRPSLDAVVDWRFISFLAMTVVILLSNAALLIRLTHTERRVQELHRAFGPPGTLELGSQAPDFDLIDLNGNEISLGDFSGRRVVLVFSSVYCPACEEFWPSLHNFAAKFGSIQIVMVSKGTLPENRDMVEAEDFHFPVVGWTDEVSSLYRVPGTPYFYLLTENHTIEAAGFGRDLIDLY